MAKRKKKLNKRVVVLLGFMGAFAIALAGVVVFSSGGGIFNRLFPQDPVALMEKGRQDFKAGEFASANKAFSQALGAAVKGNSSQLPAYYVEVAEFYRDWALDGNGLSQTQRVERMRGSIGLAQKALLRDKRYAPAQEYIAERHWLNMTAMSRANRQVDWNPYIKEADALIALKPDDPETYFRRGLAKSYMMSPAAPGELGDEALADLMKATELDSKEPKYWMGLVQFYSRIPGREDQVEKAFVKAIETNTDNAALLVDYAGYLRRQKRNKDAEEQLALAIDRDPVLGNLALASYYSSEKEDAKAFEALDRAIEARPSDSRPYIVKSRMLIRENKYEQALAILNKGLAAQDSIAETKPADEDAVRVARRADLVYLKASAMLDMIEAEIGDRKELLAQINECIPQFANARFSGPRRTRLTGRVALAEGRIADALKDLEEAYSQAPRFDSKIANLLVKIYLNKRLPGKAEEILDRLLALPGQMKNVSALTLKLQLLLTYKDFEKANRLASDILKEDKANVAAMNAKMLIAAVQGENPVLPADVKLNASTARLLLGRASNMWLDDRREEAIKYVEQIYAKAPDDKIVLSRLFTMYRMSERLDEAGKLIDDAMTRFPDDKTLLARKMLLHENDPEKRYNVLIKIADSYESPQRELEKAAVAASYGQEKEEDYSRFLKEAAKVAPDDGMVVRRLFRYALKRADWDLAKDCADRARKGNLDKADGKLYEMHIAQVQGDNDKVISLALKILKDTPNYKVARSMLGEAYLRKRFYQQSYEAFKIVHDDDPGFVPALVGLARVTRAQGKRPEHRGYVAAAYRLTPSNAYIRERKLAIEQETAKPEELIVRRERTLRGHPDDLQNILGLGVLYERVKRLTDAENMFVSFYQKNEKKILGARVLCRFYLRHKRMSDIEAIMKPLLREDEDPVAARVLYAELLARAAPAKAKEYLENSITANPEDPRGHLGLARFCADQAKWNEAAKAMTGYIRLRPDDLGGVKELIRYLIDDKDYDAAAKHIEDLLRDDPMDAPTLTLSGVLAWRQAEFEEAIRIFSRAIQNDPGFAEPLLYRARVYLAKGENSKAKADLQEAKRLTNRLDVSMQLATVFEALHDVDSAELVLREIRADRSDYLPAIDRLLRIYLRRQKWHEMEILLEEAKQIMPTDPAYHSRAAGMWRARDNVQKRIVALASALRLAPDSPHHLRFYLLGLMDAEKYDTVVEVSEPYMKKPAFAGWVASIRGAAMVKLQRLAEAGQLFRASLGSIPPEYALLLAQQMTNSYGADKCVETLSKWIEDGLDTWRAHLLLGMLYAEKDENDQAVKEFTKASKSAPAGSAKYLANRHMGLVYYKMKQFRECEKCYLEALRNHRDIQVTNNLAYMYTSDLNEPHKAKDLAARATQMAPTDPNVLDTYGWTLAKLDKLADAERILIRAVQVESPLAVSRYHLGWVYEKQGRLEEASKQFRQGLVMMGGSQDDPLYEEIKTAFERVGKKMQ